MVEQAAPQNSDNSWPFPKGKDWLLAYLAELVSFGIEFGITLNVNGAVIGGTLISGETYLEETALSLRAATKTGDGNTATDIMADRLSNSKVIYQRPEGAADDYRAPPPNYLHLRNPVYLGGQGNPIHMKGALWRGRIASVDGFSIGNFTPPS